VDKALQLLAVELNLKRGSLAHMMANTAAKRRTRAAMQCDMQTKILQKIASQQTQDKESKGDVDKERSESTGTYAGLSDEDSPTMEDGMPKLTKAEQLQTMQDKSDVIIELQRELQKDIQAYKLSRLEDLLTVPDLAILKHNKGAKRQVEEVVLWEQVPPGPGVPHKMVTKKGKWKHWCPHHHKWTQHPPEECRIQPVPDGHQGVAPNGVQRENF
jgi:hypothetical protein